MLQIVVPPMLSEDWDEVNEEFIYRTNSKEQILCLEHSLISLSKWESKWCKPFISSEKTDEEFLDYIKCMTLTQNVPQDVYDRLSLNNFESIKDYMSAPMTATTFYNDRSNNPNREVITAELIYYWMIALNIPFECEKWHINRLLTLVRVCEIKNSPKKKMSTMEIMSRNKALNEERKQKLKTKG